MNNADNKNNRISSQKTNRPTLSVILPNYNHAQYIGEALEAILCQSFSSFEVIVVDDASTDNSIEIIEQFVRRDARVRLLKNQRNTGSLSAATRGFENSVGDYVYFAAADDKVLPGFFEKSMNLLDRYPAAGLSCSDFLTMEQSGQTRGRYQIKLSAHPTYITPDELVELMIRRLISPIISCTAIVKRTALINAGGLIQELKYGCDWFFLHVSAFRYGMCYIPEILAASRLLPDSYSASGLRQSKAHRQLIINMIRILETPAYADVCPYFRRTAALSTPYETLRAVFCNGKYRGYLSANLVRKALHYKARTLLASITPAFLKRIYHRIREQNYVYPSSSA